MWKSLNVPFHIPCCLSQYVATWEGKCIWFIYICCLIPGVVCFYKPDRLEDEMLLLPTEVEIFLWLHKRSQIPFAFEQWGTGVLRNKVNTDAADAVFYSEKGRLCVIVFIFRHIVFTRTSLCISYTCSYSHAVWIQPVADRYIYIMSSGHSVPIPHRKCLYTYMYLWVCVCVRKSVNEHVS